MELTHFDDEGRAKMVNVGDKGITERVAVARGSISMKPETLEFILTNRIKKVMYWLLRRLAELWALKRQVT